MKIYVYGWIHPKNMIGINLINGRGIDFDFSGSQGPYDYIMPTDSFEIRNSYKKGIIFGPHMPLENIKNCPDGDNIRFNSLSPWLNELSRSLFKKIDFVDLHFPVDIDRFSPSEKNGKPVFYFKSRDPNIMNDFFAYNNHSDFALFDYQRGYDESNFIKSIASAPYAVWLGRHESQGFALEETLSCDTPIFVIDAQTLRDENGGYWENRFPENELRCTSASYFDERCGMVSNVERWRENFELFKKSIDLYRPRDFVLDTLSPNACIYKWKTILDA